MAFCVVDAIRNTTDAHYPSSVGAQSASTLFLPVTIYDVFNDTIALRVPLSVYPSLFPTGSPDLIYATPGQALSVDMSYYLAPSVLDRNLELSVTFEPKEASEWLTFLNSSNSLFSNPLTPVDLSYQAVNVTYEARDLITNSTSRQVIPLSIASTNIPTHSGSDPIADQAPISHKRKSILAGVIGAGTGLVVLVLLFHYCRGQEKDKHQVDDRRTALENGYAHDGQKTDGEVRDGLEVEARAFEREDMADVIWGMEKGDSIGSKSMQKDGADSEAMDYLPFLAGLFKRKFTPPQVSVHTQVLGSLALFSDERFLHFFSDVFPEGHYHCGWKVRTVP